MLEVGSSPRLGWENLLTGASPKPHLRRWAGSELFGGVAAPFAHVESTFSKIAGAGDKDGLSVSIAPPTRLISKWRYLDSLDFAQFSTKSLMVGRQLSVCRKHFLLNARSNGRGVRLKTMISMFVPLWCD